LALPNAVREVIHSVSQLQLEVGGVIEQANAHLHRSDLGLLILHMGRRKSDADEVARILENASFRCRQIGVIVISDQPNPELALALSYKGKAEFLERPLNLHRLAYLADMSTIRARHTERGPCKEPDGVAVGESESFLYSPATKIGK